MKTRFRARRVIDLASASLTAVLLVLSATPFIIGEKVENIEITGLTHVIDGDSLRIGGAEIRLTGIDAPELRQTCKRGGVSYPCGDMAKKHLRDLVGGGELRCEIAGKDRFERLLGKCRRDEVYVNRQMVADGWAVASRSFVAEESSARRAQRGIWAGSFEVPAKWRDRHPR